MKKILYFFLLTFLFSCTSNTIFKKPKDLIPKDTMSLVLQEIMIASSSKYVKNINLEKNINYMSFVYERYKIDSTRFKNSNLYYMSNIDLYQKIFNDVKANLEKQKEELTALKNKKDSIRIDSIKKHKVVKKPIDLKNNKLTLKKIVPKS
ncbi:DUF4296 domain-containing protein [Polaribacter sp. MSW13]|uniref:DUF4296 domain-containing protein n=1 Tax=Polaribacter marinus TaxID=2916838 RepID=A0A9X1VMR4_9FLAO|nr:DUF4296 domain-containing protein [Polaribacter marinus]MCI2229389.1 DUF4296 domain-containing protein [Polaribacter marinus]